MLILKTYKKNPDVRFYSAVILAAVATAATLWSPAFFILVGLGLFHLAVMLLLVDPESKKISDNEHILVGSAKISASLLMAANPVSHGGYWNLLWLGLTFLFISSGANSLYSVMKRKRREATHIKQAQDQKRIEQNLADELTTYLNDSNTPKL